MKRRSFLTGIATSLTIAATTGVAHAAGYADDVIAQLSTQGFSDISYDTTWLGRVRISAKRADGVREIILNPRTGEILRDTWMAVGADGAQVKPILDEVASSRSSGRGNGGTSGGTGSSGSGTGGSGTGSGGTGSGGTGSGGTGSGGTGSGGSGSGSDDSNDDKKDDHEDDHKREDRKESDN